MKIVRIMLFAIVAAIGAISVNAQVATGTPWLGSFGGGPDIVNLSNLNVNWTIPLINKPGRGIPFILAPTYDSSIWYPVTSNGVVSWQPMANWGWSGLPGSIGGHLTYSTNVYGPNQCGPPPGGSINPSGILYQYTTTVYSNYIYTDASGTQHFFNVDTSTNNGQCYEEQVPQGTPDATATDGHGYTLLAYPGGGSVTNPSGIAQDATPLGGFTGLQEDINGNYISLKGNVYTDTLNTQAMSFSGSSPLTITSGNATYQITYKTYTVKTAFACPNGPADYGPNQVPLVDKIVLPDGRYYQFFYEPTTTGSTDVTGRISGVKLPTDSSSGPTISYAYSGGDTGTGIMCADGSTANLSRTTPDGTWTYAQSGSGTTTMTAPNQDRTVLSFLSGYEISRQVYSASGTLRETILSCYQASTSTCPIQAGLAAYPVPFNTSITQKQTTNQFPDSSGISSGFVDMYDSSGQPYEHDTYDFGTGGKYGSLLQKHTMLHTVLEGIYDSTTGASIAYVERPNKDYIVDGHGTLVSYVEYGLDGVATSSTGAPQHGSTCSPGYTCILGNITSVKTWISGGNPPANGIAGSKYLTTSTTYYDTGLPKTTTDVNGNVTTYTYSSAGCGYAFATNTSTTTGSGPVGSLQTSTSWNCGGGVPNSTTNANNVTTTYNYGSDPYWRPVSTTNNSTGAVTSYGYQTSSSNSSSVSMTFNGGASISDSVTTYDRLGRTILQQKSQGPSATSYDSVAIAYDSKGRIVSQTLPYSAAPGVYLPSNAGNTTSYDALDRTVQVSDSGGGYISYSYNSNDVLQTTGPQASGENLKKKQLEYNGAGWLTSVCEITGGTSSAPASSCGQSTAANGYFTSYAYDGGGKLIQSVQNAQQIRTIAYDGLGRKISETIPEWSAGTGVAGTSTYTYDADTSGSCSGSFPGDMVKTVDNAGDVTCFTYDGLHRRLSSQVVAGPYATVTPQLHAVYDAASYNGTAMTYVLGSVAEAYTCSGTCSSKLTDIFFSNSPITSGAKAGGVLAQMWESTPHSNGYFLTQNTYYPNGALGAVSAQLGSVSIGIPSLGYTLDGEGRPYSAIDATNCLNIVAATFYNPSSSPTSIVYGNAATGATNDMDSFVYDPNTNRPIQFKYAISPASSSFNITGSLVWHPNGELSQMAYTDTGDSTKNQTCAYSTDDLSRIASVNCGSNIWAQSFSYDAFGNISKTGNPGISYQPGPYSAVTNQVSLAPSYDANGDQTQNTWASFSWNAAAQPVNVNGVSATYDALGRMVETGSGSSYTQFVFLPSGDELAVVQNGSLVKGTVSLPGGATAVYNAGGLEFIRHKDWLGSSRLATTWAHTVYSREAYAPFGEPYNEAGTPDRSFTGQDQNTTQGIYDYLFRKYDPTAGRWLSPDPAGWSAVDPAAPQSLNRYAYVQNEPMRLVDPDGLSPQPCYGSGDDVSTYTLCDFVWTTAWPGSSLTAISTGTSQQTISTGGGGGGGGVFAPNNPSVLQCASSFADKTSIAGGLHALGIGNNGGVGGFLTNALAGNAVSGLINVFRGKGSSADVAFGGTRGGMPGGATRLNNGISGTLQDSVAEGANAVINSGAEVTTALGGTVSTAAFTGAEYATAVGWAKFSYDAASYAAGLAGCAAGIVH